jgi:ribose transport system ATP-binding protein
VEKHLLEMREITKRFPGVHALKDVNIFINENEILALLGENGAGKSTLMKILSGVHQPNSGEILIDGKSVLITHPKHSQNLGISIIYQEFTLIPYLSIAENIFLGREPRKMLGIIDWKELKKRSMELLKRVGLKNVQPTTLVSELTVAEQQLVEIAKALSYASKVIIMDEPTAALNEEDSTRLFSIMKDLKNEGIGIIFITHRLEEVEAIADRITVLRDGEYIGSAQVNELTKDEIVQMMVGRDISQLYPERNSNVGKRVLDVENLSITDKLHKVSFNVKEGEIVGVAGLLGSGCKDLSKALFGLYPIKEGTIKLESEEITTPKQAIDAGVALVTDDRKGDGLVLGLSVFDNLLLPSLKRISTFGVLSKVKQKNIVKKWINNLNIKVSNEFVEVNTLSGGNQQKVVLGKWLQMNPKLLVLHEPTRGIDIGAKAEIYQMINELANEGMAIIVISSEMPELLGMSNRILVMNKGRLVKELIGDEASQESIFTFASGGAVNE